MTSSNTIFRRLEQQPSKAAFVSMVEAVEMMDSTDSSTEILSIDHQGTHSQSDRLDNKLDEVPSLVSEEDETETASASTKSKYQANDDELTVKLVTPDTKNTDNNIMKQESVHQEITEEKKMVDFSDVENGAITNSKKDTKPLDKRKYLNIRPRRARILSLDRGQQQHQRGKSFVMEDGYSSPDSTSNHTDGEVHRRNHNFHDHHSFQGGRSKHQSFNDEDSSSDDDSSYFASNMPSPKSGRSFSLSSTASAPARTSAYQIQKSASLSFSDESDDERNPPLTPSYNPRQQRYHASGVPSPTGVHFSPVAHPHRAVADMHLYPQRITRVHSVSSLVSSASSDNEDGAQSTPDHRHSASVGSLTSSAGTSVSSEPETNMNSQTNPYYVGNSYMSLGQENQFASATGLYLSQYYQPPSAYPVQYRQNGISSPTQEQYSARLPNSSLTLQDHQSDQAVQLYQRDHENQRTKSYPSFGSIPFVYSEDDENGPPIVALAGGAGDGGNPSFAAAGYQSGVNRGRGHTGLERNQRSLSGSDPADGVTETAVQDSNGGDEVLGDGSGESGRQVYKVYWQRWIMLMYMSILNLLSDWTCYSVAPISLLTEEAFGKIDPERLVVVFLGANAIATACEPIILARLGLRRTVLFGALLLMVGSIVKSGGLPPITNANLKKGHEEITLYVGFFLVGLSQPLYQCTPALLSASWFPEKERTMATGVALNANQLGIGFAFIFGTLLVAEADDIPVYFGLLSQISTLVFLGTLIQFDDAPPTPPSSSARAMRGDLKMPRFGNIGSIVRNVTHNLSGTEPRRTSTAEAPSPASNLCVDNKLEKQRGARYKTSRRGNAARRRPNAPSRSQYTALSESGLAGSSMHYGSTHDAACYAESIKKEVAILLPQAEAPSPAMSGRLASNPEGDLGSPNEEELPAPSTAHGSLPPMMPPGPYSYGYQPYPLSYWDPRMQQQLQQQAYFQQQYLMQQPMGQQMQQTNIPGQIPPALMYYPPPSLMVPPPYHQFPPNLQEFDPYYGAYGTDPYDDGAEPIITITPHHLDIDIRDDQVIRSLHACMVRPGFCHALAAFTVSGIVINTLSTFMDYLVRLNGAPRTYTGIVGGTFQFVIMISSLIIGKQTDKTRAYYSVTVAMLVLGAFGLAECGVSLDSDRGSDLRWSLVVVAALVGPLQPVSTELGVEVAYPLSENTVLVIQQLFSNLLSAIFIPFFKSLRDIGSTKFEDGELVERPQYTFSFYLLIVLHTGVTVYFATFNGKYLRYEHELQKEEEEGAEARESEFKPETPVHPFFAQHSPANEQQPLIHNSVV
ncbi:major facilitator superfamily transporter [Nitzschia inconspicua]|uniref:Major facilitator superfamily transporter n=1 Tax=Nitzschia inconspicua TaxID=303405 RepID=A0A9K3P9N2_9STRA|nr:major facilitator superfamily transporter [Nitzschia inconspicua]KAG7364111.1 major facilitator superfamily transporter [Nitzschia inconspicua]